MLVTMFSQDKNGNARRELPILAALAEDWEGQSKFYAMNPRYAEPAYALELLSQAGTRVVTLAAPSNSLIYPQRLVARCGFHKLASGAVLWVRSSGSWAMISWDCAELILAGPRTSVRELVPHEIRNILQSWAYHHTTQPDWEPLETLADVEASAMEADAWNPEPGIELL